MPKQPQIVIVGQNYFDVYTVEAGRDATARAAFIGGAGIVKQLLGDHAQWLHNHAPTLQYGKRVVLGIRKINIEKSDTKKGATKPKSSETTRIFAETVSSAFRDTSAERLEPPLDRTYVAPTHLRIGFHALPDRTEGEIERRSEGERFPGLGSLFLACLARDLTVLESGADDAFFRNVLDATKRAVRETATQREACLMPRRKSPASDLTDTIQLAHYLRSKRNTPAAIRTRTAFNRKSKAPAPKPAHGRTAYVCDYGDLSLDDRACEELSSIDVLLYRASYLAARSRAYQKLFMPGNAARNRKVMVAKAEHLRSHGVKLDSNDWYAAAGDLIEAAREAMTGRTELAEGDIQLRRLITDSDILIVRFDLEGAAIIQKANLPDGSASDEADVSLVPIPAKEDPLPEPESLIEARTRAIERNL